jgi:thiol-disulfide isomerase/thioredoxin
LKTCRIEDRMTLRMTERVGALAAVALAVACASPAPAPVPPETLIAQVREAVARGDIAGGERMVVGFRERRGAAPAAAEALSILAQAAFTAKQIEKAESLARETYALADEELQRRPLDAEPRLPIALGRAIEIQAQTSAGGGRRTEALAMLDRELARHRHTSIGKRIQKNVNLLTLEGAAAPALELSEHLGRVSLSPTSLAGKVVLMFFWAHWCADCKAQGPILATLVDRYGAHGLAIVAPTQRYGYVAGGEAATPETETPYIESVRATHYPMLAKVPIPVSEANHRRYGVSSTPTLVLVDRAGVVRLYHPGRMTEAELDPLVRRLVDERRPQS